MTKDHLEDIEDNLRNLNSTLHDELLRTGLMTNEQWNEKIAPKLMELSMAIEGVNVTARTYKVHMPFV